MKLETFKTIFENLDDNDDVMVDAPDDDGYGIAEKMFSFIEENVDLENLDETQSDVFGDILISIGDDDDLEEAALKKKISVVDKRERKRDYRKNKAALKQKAKKIRKSNKFKKYKKKAKKKAKIGKTASGKRKTTFI
jgi:hypothetical protein